MVVDLVQFRSAVLSVWALALVYGVGTGTSAQWLPKSTASSPGMSRVW